MIGVVIPSRTATNAAACMDAVYGNHLFVSGEQESVAVALVDDGIEWAGVKHEEPWLFWSQIDGARPFVFSRNVNIGIRHCLTWGSDVRGVVVLNDDAILQTPNGFRVLADACGQHPEFGIIAATTNNVGNLNQQPRGIGLREDLRMACFVCVYIPRTTIEKVGLLDERYVGYGLDDDDYCLRVRNAGLKIGIHDGCFVDHGSLKSSYRGNPEKPADFSGNLELFKQKWGHDNWGRPA